MNWILASLMANVCIAVVELINRSGNYGSFASTLRYSFIFILIAQFGLYRSWSTAPSMLMAWLVFTVGNNVLRLISNHYFVGEPVNWRQIAIVCAMFGCAIAMKKVS